MNIFYDRKLSTLKHRTTTIQRSLHRNLTNLRRAPTNFLRHGYQTTYPLKSRQIIGRRLYVKHRATVITTRGSRNTRKYNRFRTSNTSKTQYRTRNIVSHGAQSRTSTNTNSGCNSKTTKINNVRRTSLLARVIDRHTISVTRSKRLATYRRLVMGTNRHSASNKFARNRKTSSKKVVNIRRSSFLLIIL